MEARQRSYATGRTMKSSRVWAVCNLRRLRFMQRCYALAVLPTRLLLEVT